MRVGNRTLWTMAGVGLGAVLGRAVARRALQADVRGKTVVVTGGSRGLGLLIAQEFYARGANVVIAARDSDELARAEQSFRGGDGAVFTLRCDLRREEDLRNLVVSARSRFGSIDILVNNAGTIEVGPVETMTLADYQLAMDTHYWAPLRLILMVLPEMQSRREGRIVNISSIGGVISVPHLLPYSASKFALTGLSQGLRAELGKDGIAVTTVCPGLMRTGSPLHATFKSQYQKEFAWFAASDSLPGTSMDARRAARRVVEACLLGDAFVVLSAPAKLAALFAGMLPGLTARILAGVNRLLPGPGGIADRAVLGSTPRREIGPSLALRGTDRAAEKYNETSTRAPLPSGGSAR